MYSRKTPISVVLCSALMAIVFGHSASRANACGGFFCSLIPVTQNAEQIVFRQDGDQVVALVRIQYQGPAEEFSWVVPVPGIPDVSTSSELLFTAIDNQTRPQFRVQYEGEGCRPFFDFETFQFAAPAADGAAGGGEVLILEERAVGPFDLQIVRSDDPAAMAKWLADNNYDLTERGEELIAPYVEEGMNFVALRLQKDKDVGDLVPLKMVYTTDRPMVPIRLTAVAAEPDMGIIVWLVGPARAIPTNFPHVVVNYAKLNWLRGFGLYNEYQALVTEAMNEAGGLGFATDFAGAGADVREAMPEVETFREVLDAASGELDPAQGLIEVARMRNLPQTALSGLFAEHLPLPNGEPQFTYVNPTRLHELFSTIHLRLALDAIVAGIRDEILTPYEDSLKVLDGDPYLTRMYTTLSPHEMTLDPCFGYKSDLPDQPAERVAVLNQACILGETHWELVLGPGTERDGEVILNGVGDFPQTLPDDIKQQSSFRDMRYLSENVDPMMVPTGSSPYVNQVREGPEEIMLCGMITLPMLALNLMGLVVMARRIRRRR